MSFVLRYFGGIGSVKRARRVVRIVIGGTLLFFGILLLVLPGPAIVVIPVALAILAGEVVWARVLLKRVRHHIKRMGNASKAPDTEA